MAFAYLLGGRAYRSAAQQTTVQQDAYLMAFVHRHKLAQKIDASGDVLGAVLDTYQPGEFAAGLLVEDGSAWSIPDAQVNAKRFNALTEPADKAQFYDALALLLADFFPHGGSSSTASPISSEVAPERKRRRPRRRPALPQTPSADSGPMSSPPSPTSEGNG